MSKSVDALISFDTTGSMYAALATVKREVQKTVKELFKLYGDDLRVGIIAHGDYCDKDNPYTIKVLDFTQNINTICNYVRDIESTYGGDADECYELVLNTARTVVNWKGGSDKIFMMIGDANPHGVNYSLNENRIDWKNEATLLNDMGVKVYAVHALSNFRSSSKKFYTSVAEITSGMYLTLDNFSEIIHLVNMTYYNSYSEEKLNEYVSVIKENRQFTRTIRQNFERLNGTFDSIKWEEEETERRAGKRRKDIKKASILDGLATVPAGRFQVLEIDETSALRDFVNKNGIKFKTGRAFYELKKTEEIQQYKELIMQDKETGEFYYGSDVRKTLGLKEQSERSGDYAIEKIRPKKDDEYTIFVQSTSYNRKLPAGSKILYEIADLDSTGVSVL